jgi:hypothetical protein
MPRKRKVPEGKEESDAPKQKVPEGKEESDDEDEADREDEDLIGGISLATLEARAEAIAQGPFF